MTHEFEGNMVNEFDAVVKNAATQVWTNSELQLKNIITEHVDDQHEFLYAYETYMLQKDSQSYQAIVDILKRNKLEVVITSTQTDGFGWSTGRRYVVRKDGEEIADIGESIV